MLMDSMLPGKLGAALLLQLGILFAAVLQDGYLRRDRRRILLIISALAFTLLAQNALDAWCEIHSGPRLLRTAVSVYGYSIRPVIILLYLKLIDEKMDRKWLWVLVGLNTAVCMTAFFSGICFRFDGSNRFCRGPLNASCLVVSFLLLALLLERSFKVFRHRKKRENMMPLLAAVLVLTASVADMRAASNGFVSWLSIALVSSCLLMYIWLHTQYVREYEQALQAEQRIQIMISQIQPHFLYNTLSTIQALCRIDPEKAFETTEKFGSYLRMNIDSLGQTSLLPFRKELEHTKTYADIEMMRFPYIHIRYDIRDEDFEVPALTVQPIVENAIRHGVRGQYNGMVEVSTALEDTDHVIVVRDNGKGFDPDQAAADGGVHIGLQNVQERIRILCGGTVTVESRKGAGCTVTIRIPCGEEKT